MNKSLPPRLQERVAKLEAEAARLSALPASATVAMTMPGGGLRFAIPAAVAGEAMAKALADLPGLSLEDVMCRLGVIPVFNMVPIPGDEMGGCTLEPVLERAPLPDLFAPMQTTQQGS